MLFFYMLILLGIFVIQFSVACACLAVTKEQELKYAELVSLLYTQDNDGLAFYRSQQMWLRMVMYVDDSSLSDVVFFFTRFDLEPVLTYSKFRAKKKIWRSSDSKKQPNSLSVVYHAPQGWKEAASGEPQLLLQAEKAFRCCGFNNRTSAQTKEELAKNPLGGYKCEEVPKCKDPDSSSAAAAGSDTADGDGDDAPSPAVPAVPATLKCSTCVEQLEDKIDAAFDTVGALGLLFAFTEVTTKEREDMGTGGWR